VLSTPLTEAADFVLPGAAYVEKDAIYTNQTGHVQAASRAIAPPGEALDDWQILVNVGRALGLTLPYDSSDDVRRAIAAAGAGTPYANADQLVFHSNPSERWKWDFMYQDLPPVKGHNVQMEGAAQSAFIRLKPVE
jgi:NADH-quinone oxidoreductase subunit G